MGARAQVKVISEYAHPPVFLYTHWDSRQLPQVVARALARREGRDDFEYLSRIIFCEMVKDEPMGTTGYGIGTIEHSDLDYSPIVVDCRDNTVTHAGLKLAFDEYVAMQLSGAARQR